MGLIVPPEFQFDTAKEGGGASSGSLVKPGDPFFTDLSNELGD
jgi:NADH-quinone oxidoreductase subunit B